MLGNADVETTVGVPRSAWRRCDLALRTGDFRSGDSFARQAMAFAERAGDLTLRLRAQHRLASALAQLGDLAQAKVLAQGGLAEVRRFAFARWKACS